MAPYPALTPEFASQFARLALANVAREYPNKLEQELSCWGDRDAHRWSRDLMPLAYAFAERYVEWLDAATYPIRHGVHTNTAFALAFALDYAGDCDAQVLRRAAEAKARAWYI